MIELDSDVIALAGDQHALLPVALDHLVGAFRAGIQDLVVLGDWGFIFWPYENKAEQLALKKINATAEELGIRCWVLLGNHEGFPRYSAWEPDRDGVRWVRKNIGVLPRAGRLHTPSGAEIGYLAGAHSIDRFSRRPGRDWHPDESILDEHLATLGDTHVTALLGHEAARSRALEAALEPTQKYWLTRDLEYADESRRQFQRAVEATTPHLAVGGHYHLSLDSTESFHGAHGPFKCRNVILRENGRKGSLAKLEVSTPGDPQLKILW